MRIPGALQSIYWQYRLQKRRVRPWAELPIDAEKPRPSVAIVGNAGYLCDLDLGEEIEAHDIVVRMNNFVTDGYERSVGRRLDLYVANFAEELRFDNPNVRNAKWVMASVPCNFKKDHEHGLPFRHGIHIAKGLRRMGRDEVFVPPVSYMAARYRQLHATPTTGAMTILLITEVLRESVGQVLVAGFSFYEGRSHYYSDEQVVPEMHAPIDEKAMLAEHLRDLVTAGRVTLDPVMTQHVYASSVA